MASGDDGVAASGHGRRGAVPRAGARRASAAQGDPQAFARLVALHERMVFNLAARLLGDLEEARDVSQDVFLQVYRTLGRFEGRSSLQDLDLPDRREPVPQPPALVAAPPARPLAVARAADGRRRGPAGARAAGPSGRSSSVAPRACARVQRGAAGAVLRPSRGAAAARGRGAVVRGDRPRRSGVAGGHREEPAGAGPRSARCARAAWRTAS